MSDLYKWDRFPHMMLILKYRLLKSLHQHPKCKKIFEKGIHQGKEILNSMNMNCFLMYVHFRPMTLQVVDFRYIWGRFPNRSKSFLILFFFNSYRINCSVIYSLWLSHPWILLTFFLCDLCPKTIKCKIITFFLLKILSMGHRT